MSEDVPQMTQDDGDELARWLADELREGNIPEGVFVLKPPMPDIPRVAKRRTVPIVFTRATNVE